jgi:hypothetical protein
MGTTPNRGIPYVEPTAMLNTYPATDKAQAELLDALLLDTGWAVLASGVGGAGVRYRSVAGIGYVQVDGSFSTTSGTAATLSTGPLPAAFRPAVQTRAAGYFSGYPGTLTVDTAGNVTAVQYSGAGRTSVSGIVIYPIS